MKKCMVLVGAMMMIAGMVSAQEVEGFESAEIADSLIANVDTVEVDPDPEWYVAPLNYDSVMARRNAPRRAAAANYHIDSVLTFNVDSVLTDVSIYEYGDTTRTITWAVNSDGTRTGKAKTELANDGLSFYGATYTWDNTINGWKGVSRADTVFADINGTLKTTSRTTYAWVNQTWVEDLKYTWTYDAAGREAEYTTYKRNTSTNQLMPSAKRIREWYNASKMTLDIQYTAHNGTDWSAGTKTEYAYDANGNNTVKTYFSSLSNGNWVGSTHEEWAYDASNKKTNYVKQIWSNSAFVNSIKESRHYNGPSQKQTFYEKYTWSQAEWIGSERDTIKFEKFGTKTVQTVHEHYLWSNGDWAISVQDSMWYNATGGKTLDVKYTFTNGVRKGNGNRTEYMLTGLKSTIVSTWSNNAWLKKTMTIKDNVLGTDTVENCKYNWQKDEGYWKGTNTRTLKIAGGAEEIKQSWNTEARDWTNTNRTTIIGSTTNPTQTASFIWNEGEWYGVARTDYHYYAAGLPDTIKTYRPIGTEWVDSLRTINTYNTGGALVLTHNAKWNGSQWIMQTMTRTDISDAIVNGTRQVLNASWYCGADSIWKGRQKDTISYTMSGKTLYSARYESWANDDWVPSYYVSYVYSDDERENTLLHERMIYYEGKWRGDYKYEYAYNEQGKETMSAYYSSWNATTNSWGGTSKKETIYDSTGKTVISMINSDWSNGDWRPSTRYLYENDASSGTNVRIVQNFSNNDEWVNTLKYVTIQNNTLVESNDYKWLNGAWQFSRRNERIYDDDAQGKLRREIIGTWNDNGVVSSFSDKIYYYNVDFPFYTIRFENYDGTLIESHSVQETKTPTYTGATPAKPATAQYAYSFKGWSPAIVAVTGDATYTAEYDSVVNRYRITWLNADDVEVAVDSLEYGAMPSHEDVVKPSTSEWAYLFAGWTPAITSVTGDATYKAQLDSVRNGYRITWLDVDDTELAADSLSYGAMPNHEYVLKANTAEWTYSFVGWTPEIVSVTADATYKAQIDSVRNRYRVTWLDADDTEIAVDSLAYGATPSREYVLKANTAEWTYSFVGWTPEIATVTGDATYKAQIDSVRNRYRITWLDADDTELAVDSLAYGATPSREYVLKANTAEWTYTFVGWEPAITSVTGDATYKAQIDSVRNSYRITWLDADEVEVAVDSLAYGATPSREYVLKANTAEWTYSFVGWTPEIVAVSGDATYKAQIDSVRNRYRITWLDADDTEIAVDSLAYGATPSREYVLKANTAEWTYSFVGWTPEIAAVSADATYKAQIDSVRNSYLITFKNGEDTLQSTLVAYGTMPVYGGETPTKQADAQYTYSFNGWDAELVAVTGETTYNATFSSTVNNYTITWLLDDGTKIDEQSVAYGTTPSHTDAHKDNTAQYTITFVGWDKEFAAVTGDETYTAVFDSVVNRYTVIFYYEDGVTVLDSKEFEYGQMPSTSLIPSLPATAKYTYTFAGWSPELTPVTGNAAYTPVFDSIVNTYTVTFVNYNDMVLQSSQVPYDDVPEYTGETPIKPSNAMYHYVFTGWTPELVAVTGDARYKAVYEQVLNSYTILFYDEDGITVLDSVEVEYGEMPETSVIPTKADDEEYTYTFAGWSPKIVSATKNTSYTATYTAKLKTEGLWDVEAAEKAQKVMIDGVIYILRGGKIYTLDGTEVE